MGTGMLPIFRIPRLPRFVGGTLAAGLPLLLAGCGGGAGAGPSSPAPAPSDGPRIVQAGAPGEASRTFQGASLEELEGSAFTDADVAFMQGMIHHHAQALEMTALIPERTTSTAIRQMGLRMEISQTDEIAIMERWLRDRGLEVPEWRRVGEAAAMEHGADHAAAGHAAAGHGAMDHGAHGPGMPGMLTPEQFGALEAARGVAFDRLFLELMIQHHRGALVMVRDLYNTPGAAQESVVYQFASEVDADQDIEIRRMLEILQTLP